MSLIAVFLAFLAGGLTILSPCILPVAPVVLSSAMTQNRFAPLALALGLGSSFAILGVVLAIAESAFNFDPHVLKTGGAILMLGIGVSIIAPKIFSGLGRLSAPLSNWAIGKTSTNTGNGLGGQFVLGMLLSLIWSPCVGPTLGAAFALASQGDGLASSMATMLAFAFGASGTLILVGALIRTTLASNSAGLRMLGRHGSLFLAGSLIFVSLMSLSGIDREIGRIVVEASPGWIVDLTARF